MSQRNSERGRFGPGSITTRNLPQSGIQFDPLFQENEESFDPPEPSLDGISLNADSIGQPPTDSA
jgi:hypothetical protein